MIMMELSMPSIDKSEKYEITFKVPSLYFIIDINATSMMGSHGFPIGVEKLASLSFKCFGMKLKKTEDRYTGLLMQLKEHEGKDILTFVKHKLTLSKKNGLAEFDKEGNPVIRKDAEIIDYSSVEDENFKKQDNGQPYITGLTAQDKLLIEKSRTWKR